ncbi:MAG: HdeD family acid-resistance protein [Arenibacterium sp.]
MIGWLKLGLLGVVSIVFGFVVQGAPVVASLAVTTVTGLLLIAIGVLQVLGSLRGAEGRAAKVFSIILGALMVLLGVSFVANPLEGTISLAMLVVVLLAASGLIRLIFAYRMRSTRYFWPMLISGAASVLLAGYIVANFATASVSILGIFLGVEMLFNGFGLVVMGFFVRSMPPKT